MTRRTLVFSYITQAANTLKLPSIKSGCSKDILVAKHAQVWFVICSINILFIQLLEHEHLQLCFCLICTSESIQGNTPRTGRVTVQSKIISYLNTRKPSLTQNSDTLRILLIYTFLHLNLKLFHANSSCLCQSSV